MMRIPTMRARWGRRDRDPGILRAAALLAWVMAAGNGLRLAAEPGDPGASVAGPAAPPVAAVPTYAAMPEVSFSPVRGTVTPMTTSPEGEVKTFRVPAARSVIVSREGTPLAVNRIAERIVLHLGRVASTPGEAVAKVRALREWFVPDFPLLKITDAEVERHFQHRPWLPLAVSKVIPGSFRCSLEEVLPEGAALESVYVREYPEGPETAHLLGYIGVALPDQHGPVGKVEYLWPPTEGRAGLEKALDSTLRGRDGEVLRYCDPRGEILHQEILRKAESGDTVVLSIHLGMQRLAREQLERTGRPGAFVAVDADTGDILALVSHPTFDPNLFEGGISAEDYAGLSASDDAPLFDRAVTGAYPPGSTFKPFVALAGMDAGRIDGTHTLFSGPVGMTIDGRYFKNHSAVPEGLMDVRYALIRSCNTWFYQAALETGAAPIAMVSRRFGFGQAPEIPLPSVAAGNIPIPDTYGDPRSLANFSIGQGEVLVSPLQLAFAMAGLANGAYVPRPRLIRETIEPGSGESISSVSPSVASNLNLRPEDVEIVRDGLWGVVNYATGTAGVAAMRNPVVYGKTGTSQWSSGGQMRSLAWFAGWVDAQYPRIAFAAVTQGKGRETLSGGRSAAPVAAGFLRKVYAEAETYAVTVPEGPSRDYPSIIPAAPVPQEIIVQEGPRGPIGGFIRFLFGGGRRGVPPPQTFPEEPVFPEP